MEKQNSLSYDWSEVANTIQHLHGPEQIALTPQEVVVLTRVRNGAPYIREFIEYYQELGVAHIVFLDNQSSDEGMQIAKSYDQVSIFRSDLPYKRYKMAFIHFLLHQFGANAWSLVVDVDEFFNYPYSEFLSLGQLVKYLNTNNYNALVAQMLDQFPERLQIGKHQKKDTASSFRKIHNHFDLSEVQGLLHHPILLKNEWSNPRIHFLTGGIRKSWFGLNNIELTKVPLVRFSPEMEWPFMHHLYQARVADISSLLHHYKFRPDFYNVVKNAIEEKQYNRNSHDYLHYWETINKGENNELVSKSATAFKHTHQMIKNGFLIISTPYLRMMWHATEDSTLRKMLFEAALSLAEGAEKTNQKLARTYTEELDAFKKKIYHTKTWKLGSLIVKPIKRLTEWIGRGK